MIIWKDYMHFLISHVFLVHRLSFLSCKVQIILRFKSRLHIQHIVHGFCSIIHWLLFTLFCHISFHRKKIHYPLHQHWWMFSGLYDTGKDEGVNTCTYCFSGRHTIRLWGSNERENLCSQTHPCIQIAYWSSCFSCFFFKCRSRASKSWHRSFRQTQSSESSYSHSVECLMDSGIILQCVSPLL